MITVDFTVMGIPCLGLNGGPEFKHNEAFSFVVATEDQEETDRYWNAIVGTVIYEITDGPIRKESYLRQKLARFRQNTLSYMLIVP